MSDPVIQYCVLGAFALMFALSAMEKYHDRAAFQQQVSDYRLLPAVLVPGLANAVIVLEIVAATLLITAAYRYGAAIGMVLLLLYALGIGLNLVRGRTHIDCGCLGSAGEGISWFHVLRNLFMIGLLALTLLPTAARTLIWLDYFVIMAWLGGAILTYITANLLLTSHLNQRNWWQS
jgi:hypothetical protein